MVVDGGGHFNPAGIDGVHTCLFFFFFFFFGRNFTGVTVV